jgi:hypothetical protein
LLLCCRAARMSQNSRLYSQVTQRQTHQLSQTPKSTRASAAKEQRHSAMCSRGAHHHHPHTRKCQGAVPCAPEEPTTATLTTRPTRNAGPFTLKEQPPPSLMSPAPQPETGSLDWLGPSPQRTQVAKTPLPPTSLLRAIPLLQLLLHRTA